jgi:hypothetical protein
VVSKRKREHNHCARPARYTPPKSSNQDARDEAVAADTRTRNSPLRDTAIRTAIYSARHRAQLCFIDLHMGSRPEQVCFPIRAYCLEDPGWLFKASPTAVHRPRMVIYGLERDPACCGSTECVLPLGARSVETGCHPLRFVAFWPQATGVYGLGLLAV